MTVVDIVAVAERLGATLRRSRTAERRGTCPVCNGPDRFSVNTQKQAFKCHGCGAGGGVIALVRAVNGCSYDDAIEFLGDDRLVREPKAEPEAGLSDAARTTYAMKVWDQGVDPRGTVVEVYLHYRGLELGDDVAGAVLRWHADDKCLMALFRNILTDAPQAISRTFLDKAACKVGRKFLGPVGGAAIRLDADEEVLGGLHIGEGIETCLAARQIGLRPTWAVGSKGAIGSFPVLNGIECLTILAEPDAQKEVDICAARWDTAGREVVINKSCVGSDLNDAIRGQS